VAFLTGAPADDDPELALAMRMTMDRRRPVEAEEHRRGLFEKRLAFLQQEDAEIDEIMVHSNYAKLLLQLGDCHNEGPVSFPKEASEGPVFIVRRRQAPKYQLLVKNELYQNVLVDDLDPRWDLQEMQGNLLYKVEQSQLHRCLEFDDGVECRKVAAIIELILKECKRSRTADAKPLPVRMEHAAIMQQLAEKFEKTPEFFQSRARKDPLMQNIMQRSAGVAHMMNNPYNTLAQVREHDDPDLVLALLMSMEEGPVRHQQEKAEKEEKEELCNAQVVKQAKEEAEAHAKVKREAKHEGVVAGDHSGGLFDICPDQDPELVSASKTDPEVALALRMMRDEAGSPRHLASLQQQDPEVDQIVVCSKFAELYLQRGEVSHEGPVVFQKVNEGPVYVVRRRKAPHYQLLVKDQFNNTVLVDELPHWGLRKSGGCAMYLFEPSKLLRCLKFREWLECRKVEATLEQIHTKCMNTMAVGGKPRAAPCVGGAGGGIGAGNRRGMGAAGSTCALACVVVCLEQRSRERESDGSHVGADGIYPDDDLELALAIRMSMEKGAVRQQQQTVMKTKEREEMEQKQRKELCNARVEREAKEEAEPQAKADKDANEEAGAMVGSNSGGHFLFGVNPDGGAELVLAGTEDGSCGGGDSFNPDDDPDLAMALRMSLEGPMRHNSRS